MLNKLFGRKQPVKDPEIPGDAFDKRLSAIYAAYGQKGQASPYLIQLGLEAAKVAATTNLTEISKRILKGEVNYIDIFPGEHYQLLAAVVQLLQPKLVVELGTHLGYSSLCMKEFLPADGKLVTFDVIPWNQFSSTILKATDFDNRMEQCIDDVTDAAVFEKYRSLFESADIIFMDALKDGVQEYQFLANFAKVNFAKKCLFIFDDIRLWNMLDIWHSMEKPKLDLTSFGHWSGTGFVEWN